MNKEQLTALEHFRRIVAAGAASGDFSLTQKTKRIGKSVFHLTLDPVARSFHLHESREIASFTLAEITSAPSE